MFGFCAGNCLSYLADAVELMSGRPLRSGLRAADCGDFSIQVCYLNSGNVPSRTRTDRLERITYWDEIYCHTMDIQA